MCMQARACACWRRRIVDRERHVTATSSTTCSLCSSTTCLELMVCSLYAHTCLLTYLLTSSGHVLSTPACKLTSITEMEMSNVITAGCLALWCQHYNDRKSTPRPAVPWITQSKMEKIMTFARTVLAVARVFVCLCLSQIETDEGIELVLTWRLPSTYLTLRFNKIWLSPN